MNKKAIYEFLNELELLEEKYGLHISGCECCGSPSIDDRDGNTIANMLEFDEDGEYIAHIFSKYCEAEISDKNPQELPEILRD